MTDVPGSPFLTIDEAAELLRVNRRTLDNLRWQCNGPPFRRHGGRIVYHRDEILDWSRLRRARAPHKENASPRFDGDNAAGHSHDRSTKSEPPNPPLERHP